jgi:hypothetical protein
MIAFFFSKFGQDYLQQLLWNGTVVDQNKIKKDKVLL